MTEPSRNIDPRFLLSGALEIGGIAAVTWGCYLIAPWLALIIGGILLLVAGLAVDPPKRQPLAVIE